MQLPQQPSQHHHLRRQPPIIYHPLRLPPHLLPPPTLLTPFSSPTKSIAAFQSCLTASTLQHWLTVVLVRAPPPVRPILSLVAMELQILEPLCSLEEIQVVGFLAACQGASGPPGGSNIGQINNSAGVDVAAVRHSIRLLLAI